MAELWFEDLKRKILLKRQVCENCYKRPAIELHHCLVHDSKKNHRALTTEENLMPVCNVCHTSLEQGVNGYEIKKRFAMEQIARGYDIGKWYRELDLKIKSENWLLSL